MKNVTEHEKGTITQNEGLIILTYLFLLTTFSLPGYAGYENDFIIFSTKEFIFVIFFLLVFIIVLCR